MHAFQLNHWHLHGNRLSISLMNYYVDISVLLVNNRIMSKLRVINSEYEEMNLLFDSLEEAVAFTEDVIDKNYGVTFNDIGKTYSEETKGKSFKKKREI